MRFRLSKGKRLWAAAALASAALAGLAAAGSFKQNTVRPAVPPVPQQKQGEREPVSVVRFAIYDAGILPREARVEPGRVRLVIADRTGGSAGFVVEREASGGRRETVGRVERAGTSWRGENELRLGVGRYRVYEAGRPEVSTELVVEP